jgi:GTP-binding protein
VFARGPSSAPTLHQEERPAMSSSTRDDLRNVAIVAHVDHGKTTLVDAMLWQSGAFSTHQAEEGSVHERVMDSMDLEREKGITILAKNTAVRHGGLTINIIDTPGHADFGGEVERGLSMVDGVALLVDASEGPLPQTRFVLRKALALNLPVVLIINKVDRSDARIAEVVDETYELFLDLDATAEQIDFPIIYCQANKGQASLNRPADGDSPDSPDLEPLFQVIRETIPPPLYDESMPLQAHVTNLDASPYLGRIALCRIRNGYLKKGQTVAWCKQDGTIERVKLTELLGTEALDRVPIESAGPGDIVAIAGIPEITIGETLADPEDPRPLPVITIDEPNISMTMGINTSPLAGKSGKKLTARLVKNRLDAELVGNVSIRVLPTERPDTWEVQGRGELQLAILVEIMRRESFELTVGKPQVVTRQINGKLCEPMERLTIDARSDYQGVLIQLLALRKGRLEQMVDHGTGWIRMEYIVPARGLIGFRTEFLTETRGTGLLHHVHERYEQWHGDIRTRPTGSLVADRSGATTGFALSNLQERGTMFVAPGTNVYEGMIVGENSRSDDMDVNATKEKKLTNMRQSASDTLVPLIPHRHLSLEQALEFCREDECVEVTPDFVRIRKVVLPGQDRARLTARRKRE